MYIKRCYYCRALPVETSVMQAAWSLGCKRHDPLKCREIFTERYIQILQKARVFSFTSVRTSNLIFMDPCIVDYSVEIPTRCSFVIEFIIPKFFEG